MIVYCLHLLGTLRLDAGLESLRDDQDGAPFLRHDLADDVVDDALSDRRDLEVRLREDAGKHL